MTEDTRALKLLHKQFRERMNDLADSVATGDVKSYEEYKYLCGEIRGLAFAERQLLDLAEQMERNDGF